MNFSLERFTLVSRPKPLQVLGCRDLSTRKWKSAVSDTFCKHYHLARMGNGDLLENLLLVGARANFTDRALETFEAQSLLN